MSYDFQCRAVGIVGGLALGLSVSSCTTAPSSPDREDGGLDVTGDMGVDSQPAPGNPADAGSGGDPSTSPEASLDRDSGGDIASQWDASAPPTDASEDTVDASATDGSLDASATDGSLDAPGVDRTRPPIVVPCTTTVDPSPFTILPSAVGVGSDSVIIEASYGPGPEVVILVEGQAAASCGRSRALVDARYFRSPGSVPLTLNVNGKCANVDLPVKTAAESPLVPTITKLDPSAFPLGGSGPPGAGVYDQVTGTGFTGWGRPIYQDVFFRVGKDCAHESIVTRDTVTETTARVLLSAANIGSAGSLYMYATTQDTISQRPPPVVTSTRVPLVITGTNPLPEIAAVSPSTLFVAAVGDWPGNGQIRLTAVDRFTSEMEIIGVRGGVSTTLGRCAAYDPVCGVPALAAVLQEPGVLEIYAEVPGGARSPSVTIPVVVPTPSISAVSRGMDGARSLTREGFSSQEILVRGMGLVNGAATPFLTHLFETTSKTEIPISNRLNVDFVSGEVPAALLAHEGTLSFQLINRDGPTEHVSNTFDVPVVAGPWLDPGAPLPAITPSAPTFVFRGSGLDYPPQGGTAMAVLHNADGGSCSLIFQIVPSSTEEAQWTLTFSPEMFQELIQWQCRPPVSFYAEIQIPGAPRCNNSGRFEITW